MRQIHRHIHLWHTLQATLMWHINHTQSSSSLRQFAVYFHALIIWKFFYIFRFHLLHATERQRRGERRQTLLNNVGSKQHLKLTQKRHKDSHRGPFYAAGSNPIFTRVKFQGNKKTRVFLFDKSKKENLVYLTIYIKRGGEEGKKSQRSGRVGAGLSQGGGEDEEKTRQI